MFFRYAPKEKKQKKAMKQSQEKSALNSFDMSAEKQKILIKEGKMLGVIPPWRNH